MSLSDRWRTPLRAPLIRPSRWWLKPEPAPGKTYAYLAPALRAKKKVIISTGSKALQDQLYSRDLPTVAKALKYKGRLALLKGRSNYLCLERLEQQALAGGDLPVQTLSDVIILRAWANQTEEGDISTCASVPEDSPGLAAGDQHQRQLPRQRLPAV